MRKLQLSLLSLTALLTAACVTINVYFPEAAARQAADQFIGKVWGEDARPVSPAEGEPQSALQPVPRLLLALADLVVPAAAAQSADLDIETPAIRAIQSSMAARHEALRRHYESGAIGLAEDGRIALRDAGAVGLRDRGTLNQLIAEDNRDRDALYAEVARANGHPEWEAQIRSTWAQRWVARAPAGWWYRSGGGWQQK